MDDDNFCYLLAPQVLQHLCLELDRVWLTQIVRSGILSPQERVDQQCQPPDITNHSEFSLFPQGLI